MRKKARPIILSVLTGPNTRPSDEFARLSPSNNTELLGTAIASNGAYDV